ncbi:hypothetical protein Goshw_017468 [Gossypium schwendimanii]|uniref:DUF4283 domain-containing protein n=1 Tax=Gossypium schwendimanii TaxID=34291 RepID=A0A7J9LP31_GOSSC|nr:hypothetical protein [Gossypium schwendimanii]
MSDALPTVEFAVGANPLGLNSNISRATKKARTRSDLMTDKDDPIGCGNGDGDCVPSINFSNLVKDYIGRRMARTIIDEEDFNKALVGGPWVIDGHYLSVSEARVDDIISKIWYLTSFQVEANWFAGGIWICWNEDFPVDVLDVYL